MITEKNKRAVVENIEDPIKVFEELAKKIKYRKKIDVHAIEKEYEERWKKS